MSGVGIDIGITGRRTHVTIEQQVFGVAHEVIQRDVQAVVEEAQVEADVGLFVGFPLQVGVDFGCLGKASAGYVTTIVQPVVHDAVRRYLVHGEVGGVSGVTGLSPSHSYLQVAEEVEVLDEVFFGCTPGQGEGGESTEAIARTEFGGAVATDSCREEVLIHERVVDAAVP